MASRKLVPTTAQVQTYILFYPPTSIPHGLTSGDLPGLPASATSLASGEGGREDCLGCLSVSTPPRRNPNLENLDDAFQLFADERDHGNSIVAGLPVISRDIFLACLACNGRPAARHLCWMQWHIAHIRSGHSVLPMYCEMLGRAPSNRKLISTVMNSIHVDARLVRGSRTLADTTDWEDLSRSAWGARIICVQVRPSGSIR